MAFSTILRKFVRSAPAGTGQNSVTVSAKRHTDDVVVGSAATAGTGDEAGLATITLTDYEPHYLSATVGADTLMASSRDVGFIGTISGYDLDLFGLLWTDGVVKGRDNELAATAAGSDMEVDLATGAVMVLGHGARNTASAAVVIGANASGSTRHDLIVVRFVPRGQTTEGDFSFAVVAGTPGAGIPPAVTQSAAVWEIPIASVSVANGAATISTGNLTDLRVFCYPRALDLDSATLAGTLPITGGGTGAATAAAARTNLGLAAAGAGDIWVEKAGDAMTGDLSIADNDVNALLVQKADGTDKVRVDTVTGAGSLNLSNAADLIVFSGDGVGQVFRIDGATGDTELVGVLTVSGDGNEVLVIETAAGLDKVIVDTTTGDGSLNLLNEADFLMRTADGTGTETVFGDGVGGSWTWWGGVLEGRNAVGSATQTWSIASTTGAAQFDGEVATTDGVKVTATDISALIVERADGTDVLNVDTTNGRVVVGDTGLSGHLRLVEPTGGTNVDIRVGTGNPNGSVTADPGSLYVLVGGGAGGTLFVKNTGVGTNTGWAALS